MELVMNKMKEIKCYCGHTITCDCEPLKKQTAVEWLIIELNQELNYIPITQWDRIKDLIQRAKEIEKEQIMQAVYDSMGLTFDPNMGRAELYYKEKYGI